VQLKTIFAHVHMHNLTIFAYLLVQIMDELLELSVSLINNVSLNFKRSLYDNIGWDNRLIGVKGARGTGKTTMLLQWLKQYQVPDAQKAYLSLDELYFTSNSLLESARDFYLQGGKVLVLDEVHKYPTWAQEIKNLYDRYEGLKIIFTGSSIIDMAKQEADLSRRAIMYELKGLSYREFLRFQYGLDFPIQKLEDILTPDYNLTEIFSQGFQPLSYFKEYLQFGYYPFSKEDKEGYFRRLSQLARTIVEYDMAEMKGFDIRHAKKMLQLLYVVAQQVPFKPKINKLAEKTGIHRNSIGNYLTFLHEARLIQLLYQKNYSIAALQKPEKIYMDNTNLLYALSEATPSEGTIRETFFHNQLSINHTIHASAVMDFLVNNEYQFEIGGKNKSNKQLQGASNSWIVKDNLEKPVGKSLPLWLFGFLS